MAAVDDNIREVEWRDLADTVLVFVCLSTLINVWSLISSQDGLFAAFLSAFLVFLIPQLQPNSTDVSMDVLIHISQQLSNSTTPAFVPTVFQVSSNAAVVNTLFFYSLVLVLIDAFLAMLVKGWLQEFDRGWRKCTVAHLRAQERERRLQELERWKLHELVALLPILIQGSLFLFCIGLLVLIFPLHLPSAILFLLAFASGVGFYGIMTYASIVNTHAPFSSPVSRLLARGIAILHNWHLDNIRRIAPAIPSPNRHLLSTQEQEANVDASRETTQRLPSNNRVAMSEMVPRSRSDIDPQTHVHVLERLVLTTVETAENIPIFLELLDQPVKNTTLRPFNIEKWQGLLHITLGLLGDPSTLPVSAAWTVARTMMICQTRETADRQFCRTLQYHLGSRETDDQRPRMPLNHLLSSYLEFWLGNSHLGFLSRTIAFLEPSDAADAELLWMVNTFHGTMQSEDQLRNSLGFYIAVLTYVSSTEQSRRSKVPLTAAVINAMHTITSALDQGGINSIDSLCILPGTVSTFGSTPMTFCQVDSVGTLDLWSEGCTQLVKELLQWNWGSYYPNGTQLSLIAALYIDSIKQAHARSTFADLLKYTNITHVQSEFSDSYDHGKLALYWYMALSQKPLDQDRDPLAAPYDVIAKTIAEYSTLQLSGLRILEIAVKYVHKTAPSSSDWLNKWSNLLGIIAPGNQFVRVRADSWLLLHLDTLLAPQPYILPEEVKKLTWSDAPEKVYIAKARLALYDSVEKGECEGSKWPKPDPELLRVFLWSKNHAVCIHAFKWCLELVRISQPSEPRDGDSTETFIPATMGHEWVEHFVPVLCKGDYVEMRRAWGLLNTHLAPIWSMLPSSWCCDFASVFLFSIVHRRGVHEYPAHQYFVEAVADRFTLFDGREVYLPFLATMLHLVKSSLTWARLTSLETWLAKTPDELDHDDARTELEHILATRKQHLVGEETLGLLAELPMAWMDSGHIVYVL